MNERNALERIGEILLFLESDPHEISYLGELTDLVPVLLEERDRLREALQRIADASNHYAMVATYSEGTLRYAHKSTRNLARAALEDDQ